MMGLCCPRKRIDLIFEPSGMWGRFYVVQYDWLRYIVVQLGDDELYRWVGPKPMLSKLQAARVAQALCCARNDGYDIDRASLRANVREQSADVTLPA